MKAKLNQINLDKLGKLIRLPDGKAAYYMEACVWCMDQNKHKNGVKLELQFDSKTFTYPVFWPDETIDIEKIRNYYNIDDALPYGAEIIAIFVTLNHSEFSSLKRSVRKTGIDYWLSDDKSDQNLPFQNAGRLEISGILKQNEENTISKRIRVKLKQTNQSDGTSFPVYVVVVAFDQPCAKMVVKNVIC